MLYYVTSSCLRIRVLTKNFSFSYTVLAFKRVCIQTKLDYFSCLYYSVRKLTNVTEKLTKSLLDGVGIMSGSVMTPVLKSQPGQAFLNMLPGEVLLASLDAVSK